MKTITILLLLCMTAFGQVNVINNAKLTGTATVPSGSTLSVQTGSGTSYVNVTALGWIDAGSYGAKGDSSTDNTTPFQNAANAALASNSHTLLIRAATGTYNFSGTVNIPAGVTIRGETEPGGDLGGYTPWTTNPFKVRLFYTGLSGTAFYVPQASGTTLRDIELFGFGDCGLCVGGSMQVNSVTNGTTTVTVSGVNAFAFYNGLVVSGQDIPANTTVTGVSGAPVRTVASVNGNTTLNITGSHAGIVNGMTVQGYGIPNDTTVSSGGGTATITISNAATQTATGHTYTFSNTSISLTLSHAATGSDILVGNQGLIFSDPNYLSGTNFPLFGGTNFFMTRCYIHEFGCNVSTYYVSSMSFSDCLLQNATRANARLQNVIGVRWDNMYVGNDYITTDCPIGISAVQGSATLQIRTGQMFNCRRFIDCQQSNIHISDLAFEGRGDPAQPIIDISQSGGVTGEDLHIQVSSYLSVFRIHDGSLNFANAGGSIFLPVTGCGTTSTSTAATVSSNEGLTVGMIISGTGISSGTYLAAISGTNITLSQAATATGTATLTFSPPQVQMVSELNVNVSSSDSLYWKETIDGTTLLPTGAFAYPSGLSASDITSGTLAQTVVIPGSTVDYTTTQLVVRNGTTSALSISPNASKTTGIYWNGGATLTVTQSGTDYWTFSDNVFAPDSAQTFAQIFAGSSTNANRTVFGFQGSNDAGMGHTSGGASLTAQAVTGTGAAVDHLVAIGGVVKLPLGVTLVNPLTVATLPGTPVTGMECIVSDAVAFTPGTIVTGSGSVVAPVFYNGTNWVMY